MIILLSARHSSREQKAQGVMLLSFPDNPGLLFIFTALSIPCAVILNSAGGFFTSLSRKSILYRRFQIKVRGQHEGVCSGSFGKVKAAALLLS